MQRLFVLLVFMFVAATIYFPVAAFNAAKDSVVLCISVVIPSLFPFLVGSRLLVRLGFGQMLGRFFSPIMRPLFGIPGSGALALAMGMTSGFPVGANISVDLYTEGQLTKKEAARLIAFTNNAGPLFILGTIATGLYQNPAVGWGLYVCQIISALLVGIFLKKLARYEYNIEQEGTNVHFAHVPFGKILGESVETAVMTMLNISGFIVLFSVIISILSELSFLPMSLIAGVLEITTASRLISIDGSFPLTFKLAMTGMVLGWSGLAVFAQVAATASPAGISLIPYTIGKFMQGSIAFFLTYGWFLLFPIDDSAVFLHNEQAIGQTTGITFMQNTIMLFCLAFVMWILSVVTLWLLSKTQRKGLR